MNFRKVRVTPASTRVFFVGDDVFVLFDFLSVLDSFIDCTFHVYVDW